MRRKKMNFCDLVSRFSYYKYAFYTHKGTGVRGCMYWLEKPLTENDKMFVLSWKNTDVLKSCSEYAPEQVHDVIFIAEKCIR